MPRTYLLWSTCQHVQEELNAREDREKLEKGTKRNSREEECNHCGLIPRSLLRKERRKRSASPWRDSKQEGGASSENAGRMAQRVERREVNCCTLPLDPRASTLAVQHREHNQIFDVAVMFPRTMTAPVIAPVAAAVAPSTKALSCRFSRCLLNHGAGMMVKK